MQMFGVGLPELLIIMFLTVVVVGPDRLPAVAADLARWIRRTRQYATHLTKAFNEVIGELEKEAGTSREDWKEIASLVTRHSGDLGKEFQTLGNQLESSTNVDLDAKKNDPADEWTNVVPFEAAKSERVNGSTNGNGTNGHEAESEETPADGTAPAADQPWYVPERTTRRRARD